MKENAKAARFALVGGFVFAAMMTSPIARAATVDDFAQANAAFAHGQYGDAAKGFERALATRGYSAALLFDLGNANAKLGKTAAAVIDYERALRLAPNDPVIAHNLAFIRQRDQLGTPAQTFFEKCAARLTATEWSVLATMALWLLVVCIALLSRRRARWIGASAVLSLFIAAAALLVVAHDSHRAVVMADAAAIVVSPFDGATPTAQLKAGEEVKIVGRYGDYRRIVDGHGHIGWLPFSQLELIETWAHATTSG